MLVNSDGSSFIISSSTHNATVSRNELVDSTFKYRCEVIQHFRSLLGLDKDEVATVSESAEQLIVKICDANRDLF